MTSKKFYDIEQFVPEAHEKLGNPKCEFWKAVDTDGTHVRLTWVRTEGIYPEFFYWEAFEQRKGWPRPCDEWALEDARQLALKKKKE